MWVSGCVVHVHLCAYRCKRAWAHTHRSPEDAGCPALSISLHCIEMRSLAELRARLAAVKSQQSQSLTHSNEVTGSAWLFTSVLRSEPRDSHFPTTCSSYSWSHLSSIRIGMFLREGTIHAFTPSSFYPNPSYKWFLLHYLFQHKEACVPAMFLNRCVDFSVCDHAVVLQILA